MEEMKLTRIYDAENELANAMSAVADPSVTRDDMASFYADCIRCGQAAGFDWGKLNRAITARWPKGLDYIKTLAWKQVRATPVESFALASGSGET